MPNSLDAFWSLLTVRIYKCGTLMALVNSPKASRLEIRASRPGVPLTWRDQDVAVKFMRGIAAVDGTLVLITNGRCSEGQEPEVLVDDEIRFFLPKLDPASDRLELIQASRLYAGIALTRLQMKGMMSRALTPCGPHRGYQQLYLPGPFY